MTANTAAHGSRTQKLWNADFSAAQHRIDAFERLPAPQYKLLFVRRSQHKI